MSESANRFLLTACLFPFLTSWQARAELWTQATWEGGPGQQLWSDTTMYYTDRGMDWQSTPGDLMLRYPGWENTGDLAGAAGVDAIIQTSDGALYAGTSWNGDVFKSTDAGTTWVNTGELHPEVYCVHALLEGSDGAIYAAVPFFGSHRATVFKTTDGGTTWFEPGSIPDEPLEIYDLIETHDGSIYASGDQYAVPPQGGGAVFRTTDRGVTWTRGGELDSALHVWTVFQAANGTLYAGADYERPFWSTDRGATWQFTGRAGWVYEFIQDSQGALYAGADDSLTGCVLKSVDAGTTWVKMAELPGADLVESMLLGSDGTIYAGTGGDFSAPQGAAFRSTDAGTTWVRTGALEEAYFVCDLLQTSDGAVYAATAGYDGHVFRSGVPLGDLISSVYDAGPSPEYGIMSWDETLNGQSLLMKVRTDTLSDMSTAPDWDSCPPAVNGADISSLSSVNDGEPYIQYRVEMASSGLDSTAVLHEVRIEYNLTGTGEEGTLNDQLSMTNVHLMQNVPNPFTNQTQIAYSVWPMAETGNAIRHKPLAVTLTVYDVSGRLVKTLVDDLRTPGTYSSTWHARDEGGKAVPSGVYFYRLRPATSLAGRQEGRTAAKKMVLLR